MMKKSFGMPEFSVVIPVCNGEKYLREALESVLADKWDSFELIVVDDGSSDATPSIAHDFPGVRYHFQENQGVAVARNEGIRLARGRYLVFLDSDDIWLPGRFGKTLDFFRDNPWAHYVVGYVEMFLEQGFPRPPNIKPEWLEGPLRIPGTCTMAARREVFERVGLFNSHYRSGEDLEWFQRASEAGIEMAWLPVPLVRKRIHENNLSTLAAKDKKARLLLMMREAVKRKKEKDQ